MQVPRDDTVRPWPVPETYQEARPARHRAVYVHLPDRLVVGELLQWLRNDEYGWYGYVMWENRRTLNTEPVPAYRLSRYPHRPDEPRRGGG